MLKPCKVKTYVSVDGGPKRRLWSVEYKLTERELPNSFEYGVNFSQIVNHQFRIPNVTTDVTLFRNKPYINILYASFDKKRYDNFDELRVEECEELWEDATLKDIYECAPADQCIQYLKERGMTACPILK